MSKITDGLAYFGLVSAVMGSLWLPKELRVQTAICAEPLPDVVRLEGVVRDVRSAHVDFDVVPASGFAHYADMVQRELGAGGYPVMNEDGGGPTMSTGIMVDQSVLLKTKSRIIGDLHTNITAGGGITLSSSSIDGNVTVGMGGDPASVIDSSDSTISGTTAAGTALIPFDPIIAPDDTVVGPNLGGIEFGGGGETLIDSNRHYASLRIKTDAIVRISGDVTIFAEGDFTLETGGSIVVDPGGSLALYTNGKVGVKTKSVWSEPTRTTLYVVGSPQVKFETEAEFHGAVVAPEAHVLVKTKSAIRGALKARSLAMETESSVGTAPVAVASESTSYIVTQPWRNAAGQAIAPHMLKEDLGAGSWHAKWGDTLLAAEGKLTADDPGTLIDGYEAGAGPYGGANTGLGVVISTNGTSSNIVSLADMTVTGDVLVGPGGNPATAAKITGCTITGTVGSLASAVQIPTPTEPALGPNVGDVKYENGTFTLADDLHGAKVSLTNATLRITEHVTMLVTNEFKVSDDSIIEIDADASLILYSLGNTKFENGSTVNDLSKQPMRFDIRKIGSGTIEIDGGSIVHAWVTAPDGGLAIQGASTFYGRFRGSEFHLWGGSEAHLDKSGVTATCTMFADTAGTAGAAADAGVDSAISFASWFRDTLGVNVSLPHTLRLTNDGTGVYEYLDDTFHPVNGLGFGNEGTTNNRFFTFSAVAAFDYEECGGQFVDFSGADDFWLYIDGRLVMDIGGVGTVKSQIIELDRLGLTDGARYGLHLFYAQRTPFNEQFRLRTNLLLDPAGATTASAAFD